MLLDIRKRLLLKRSFDGGSIMDIHYTDEKNTQIVLEQINL